MPALFSKLLPAAQNRLPMLWTMFKRHGHARVLTRTANQTTWMRGKDHLHFYTLLGLIIWGIWPLAFNTLYGPCQLIDTPEGYEPRFWEYDKHPLVQTICKYTADSPQAIHEQFLGQFYIEMRKKHWEREEKRARRLMYERQDYKAWYYVPYRSKWIEWSHWEFEANKARWPHFIQMAN